MILEKNKEIQYMNMHSIVLKILVIKFLDRDCSTIVFRHLLLEQTFLGTASVCRIFNSNFQYNTSISYIEFRLLSTKL